MARLDDLNVNFDDITDDFKVLGPGRYAAQVVKSEIKPGKNDPSTVMLNLQFGLLGKNKGRVIFSRMIRKHHNPEAVKMGLLKFKQLCHAIGLDPNSVSDSSELHGAPVTIELIQQEFNGRVQNEIKKIETFDEESLSGPEVA